MSDVELSFDVDLSVDKDNLEVDNSEWKQLQR
jgi:hypothetical protein